MSRRKIALAAVVALSTVVSIVSWWLIHGIPIILAYFSLLIVVAGYLLMEAVRTRSSLAGVLLSLTGLVILSFGVSFSDVGGAVSGAQPLAWLIPPDAGIRLGDGFRLEFYTDSYTYRVNTVGVLAGYSVFVIGLWLVDFEEA